MKRKLPQYIPDDELRVEVQRILKSLKAIGLHVVKIEKDPKGIGCLEVVLAIALFVAVVIRATP